MSYLKQWKREFMELLKLPNVIIENGLIKKIEYKNDNNETHRNSLIGPASIQYYEIGNINCKKYYENGKSYRLDGPTFIGYRRNYSMNCEQYCENDMLHRLDGPAFIWYYENGNIDHEEYYENGTLIPHNN